MIYYISSARAIKPVPAKLHAGAQNILEIFYRASWLCCILSILPEWCMCLILFQRSLRIQFEVMALTTIEMLVLFSASLQGPVKNVISEFPDRIIPLQNSLLWFLPKNFVVFWVKMSGNSEFALLKRHLRRSLDVGGGWIWESEVLDPLFAIRQILQIPSFLWKINDFAVYLRENCPTLYLEKEGILK